MEVYRTIPVRFFFLDGVEGASEEVLAQLLETSTSKGCVEVDTLEERVDFDGGGGSGRESSFGVFAGGAETTEGTRIEGNVLLVLAFELLDEVVHEPVVEVFTTQVGVTGSGLDLEDTLFNRQERDIESSSTQIEDENVAFALDLLVKTVCDGSSSGLIDNTKNVETRDCAGILRSLSL